MSPELLEKKHNNHALFDYFRIERVILYQVLAFPRWISNVRKQGSAIVYSIYFCVHSSMENKKKKHNLDWSVSGKTHTLPQEMSTEVSIHV